MCSSEDSTNAHLPSRTYEEYAAARPNEPLRIWTATARTGWEWTRGSMAGLDTTRLRLVMSGQKSHP